MTAPNVPLSPRFRRVHQWWQRGPWHKAALLAVLPLLAVCACCSGSFVFAMTPYGQKLARQTEATETVQAEGQATANASATQYAVLHPVPTVTPRPTPTAHTAAIARTMPTPTPKPTATPKPTPDPMDVEDAAYMHVLRNANLMGKPTAVLVGLDGSLAVNDTLDDYGFDVSTVLK